MKNILFVFFMTIFIFSCNKDNKDNADNDLFENDNSVADLDSDNDENTERIENDKTDLDEEDKTNDVDKDETDEDRIDLDLNDSDDSDDSTADLDNEVKDEDLNDSENSETDQDEVNDPDIDDHVDSDPGDDIDTEDPDIDIDDGDTGDDSDADGSDPFDPLIVFETGEYAVSAQEYSQGDNEAPRDFKVYEPLGAENPPVVHFLHGTNGKMKYYDGILTHLASHGFVVVSSQYESGLGVTSATLKVDVKAFIAWMKSDLTTRVTVTPDLTKLGLSAYGIGCKAKTLMLNDEPSLSNAFFGIEPIDYQEVGGPNIIIESTVNFTGNSMFLSTEKFDDNQSSMVDVLNYEDYYSEYPSRSWYIVAAGVGPADMMDESYFSECGMQCMDYVGSDDPTLNTAFRVYTGGLMAAFFSYSLKEIDGYEAVLSDTTDHPFSTVSSANK